MQATGRTLAGRYRLENVIGRGGMSTVYLATDETLGRTVAVKVLLASLIGQDPTYTARFEREARAAAALAHPSVVTVYDTGIDGASHYIVMEYVAGRSLQQKLDRGQPLGISEALRTAIAVSDALAVAHAAGILHRDIKPANVMISDAGNVKVLDFGIARSLDGTAITQVASVVGTAAYMAPERALGQPGDARADVYSLGCLLYAMLTAAPPFRGEISAAVLHQQINAPPRPPSERRPDIPPALDALVLGTLAKSPVERPATAAEVRDRLMAVVGAPPTAPTRPLTAATAPTASAGAAGPRSARAVAAGHPWLLDHRRRAVLMAAFTGVIALIAVALLSGSGRSRDAIGLSPAKPNPLAPLASSRSQPPTHSGQRPPAHPQPAPGDSAAHAPPPPTAARNGDAPPAPSPGPPGHGREPPGQAKKGGD